jgi:hypothetical protein
MYLFESMAATFLCESELPRGQDLAGFRVSGSTGNCLILRHFLVSLVVASARGSIFRNKFILVRASETCEQSTTGADVFDLEKNESGLQSTIGVECA